MLSELLAHIGKFVNLNTREENLLTEHFTNTGLNKKEYLLKEGQVCKHNYFVAQGCLRMFFINEKGTEQITQFAIENWWINDTMSLIKQTPSEFSIQAVEDSKVFCLHKDAQQILYDKVPSFQQYMHSVEQHAHAAAQMRMKYLYSYSKEEHYINFIQRFPEFAQRVPQYMLASFLGFTPEYLSELRKKLT